MYLALIIVGVFVFLIFPYIDANYFYYKRINNRIEILSKVTELNEEKNQNNDLLLGEYNSILDEIATQPQNMINNLFIIDLRPGVKIGKFISAGRILWSFAVRCLLIDGFDKKILRFVGFILFVVTGVGIGFLAVRIPNIINPWINYFAIPLLEIISVILLIPQKNDKR